jgi:hypothetical protein
MPEDNELDTSMIDTVLDAGDHVALSAAIENLGSTIKYLRDAMGAVDKVSEFERLRAGYEALKRAEGSITPIMFKFVGK